MTLIAAAAPDGTAFGPARRDDLDALASIERGSPRGWPRESLAEEIDHDPPTLFVLRSTRGVLAFAVVRLHLPEMDIVNLAVAGDLRRKGLGRCLLRSLLEHSAAAGVESVFLEVRESNLAARRLYEGAGFRESQRRRGFYRDPVEDGVLMRLPMSHRRG